MTFLRSNKTVNRHTIQIPKPLIPKYASGYSSTGENAKQCLFVEHQTQSDITGGMPHNTSRSSFCWCLLKPSGWLPQSLEIYQSAMCCISCVPEHHPINNKLFFHWIVSHCVMYRQPPLIVIMVLISQMMDLILSRISFSCWFLCLTCCKYRETNSTLHN